MRTALLVAGMLPALSACTSGGDDPPPAKRCFVGDESELPEIELVYRDAEGRMQPLEPNGRVPLILPPQGGKVMFVGVRARNLDGCPITLSTSLRDICGDAVIALERRPVQLEPTGDGWLAPLQPTELSNYSNLPACPRANINRDIHDQPYLLTVRAEDKDGRMAEASLEITPFCAEAELLESCECECRADYKLGNDCAGERPDAGETCDRDAG